VEQAPCTPESKARPGRNREPARAAQTVAEEAPHQAEVAQAAWGSRGSPKGNWPTQGNLQPRRDTKKGLTAPPDEPDDWLPAFEAPSSPAGRSASPAPSSLTSSRATGASRTDPECGLRALLRSMAPDGQFAGRLRTTPWRCGGRQAKDRRRRARCPPPPVSRLSLFDGSAWSDRHPVHVWHVGQDDLLVGAVEVGLIRDRAAAPPEDMTAIGRHCA